MGVATEDGPATATPGGAIALLSGDYLHGGQAAYNKTSPDGLDYAGGSTALGSDPGEAGSWSWSFKVSH